MIIKEKLNVCSLNGIGNKSANRYKNTATLNIEPPISQHL